MNRRREPPVLLLSARPCGECLTTRNRVVSGERAAEIVRGCRRTGKHFQCHKGSIAGLNVHCRGVHDLLVRQWGGSTAYQIATRFGIEVREVNPDALEGGEDRP